MEERARFPYGELVFDKAAGIVDRAGVDDVLALAGDGAPLDVVVLAHGWNNDIDDARALYAALAAQLRALLDAGTAPEGVPERIALLGVLWPSKRFADAALIPSGAAGARGAVTDAALQAALDGLTGTFDAPDADARLARARALVPRLDASPAAQDEFVDLLRGAVGALADADVDDVAGEYRTLAGRAVLERLAPPILGRPREQQGGAGDLRRRTPDAGAATGGDGVAAGLSLSGVKAAAERLLNLTTYYQMKARAGTIGVQGVNPRLRELRAASPALRLHLVGHSFGGRLMTAATAGAPGDAAVGPETLTLLQAAFSHYGFAKDYEPGQDGFFRRLVGERMTRGPVLVTHSIHDSAVGYAYPLASRLAGFAASALGDAGDRFGGIGRNGAQKTPEAIDLRLQEPGQPYAFTPGAVHNLDADAVIQGHSDVRGPQVAHAVLSALAA